MPAEVLTATQNSWFPFVVGGALEHRPKDTKPAPSPPDQDAAAIEDAADDLEGEEEEEEEEEEEDDALARIHI
mgnify:CR=1 FL=1